MCFFFYDSRHFSFFFWPVRRRLAHSACCRTGVHTWRRDECVRRVKHVYVHAHTHNALCALYTRIIIIRYMVLIWYDYYSLRILFGKKKTKQKHDGLIIMNVLAEEHGGGEPAYHGRSHSIRFEYWHGGQTPNNVRAGPFSAKNRIFPFSTK